MQFFIGWINLGRHERPKKYTNNETTISNTLPIHVRITEVLKQGGKLTDWPIHMKAGIN